MCKPTIVRVKIVHVEGLFGKDEKKFDIGVNNVMFRAGFCCSYKGVYTRFTVNVDVIEMGTSSLRKIILCKS